MLRTFISIPIDPPAELRQMLATVDAMLRDSRAGRAIAPDMLHATLRFLGDIDEAQVAPVADAVRGAIGAARAQRVPLVGLGAFPGIRRPSVVWVGLRDAGLLAGLAERINAGLAARGFAPPDKPFAPHVTIARLKARPPRELFALLQEHAATPLGEVTVREVCVMRSELLPRGPRYSVVAAVPLPV